MTELNMNQQTKQNLALFDLDNTLLAGDSDYNWSLFLIEEGLLDERSHKEIGRASCRERV